jgi:methylisocitrate lyase
MREISTRLRPLGKPLLLIMARSGKSPFLSLREAHDLGFDYALCPIEPMFAMHKAVKTMMERFKEGGCATNAVADLLTPFEDFNNFVGLAEMVEDDRRFST